MSPAGIDAATVLLDRDDRKALSDLVDEFARTEIAPRTSQPANPAGPGTVDLILSRLAELGVLTGAGEPGPGIWDLPGEPASCRLSLHLLGQLARTAPAIGYAAHLRALAGWCDRAAASTGAVSLVSFDRVGTAGGAAGRATGRALAGAALDADDAAALAGSWGAGTAESPQLLVGTDSWRHIWWPRWRSADGFHLVRTGRGAVARTALPHAHGLDELTYQCWHGHPGKAGEPDPVPGEAGAPGHPGTVLGVDYIVDAFALHGMGLLAVATATADRAVHRARDYARTRRQGGAPIGAHDAVAQLLGRSQQSLATAAAVLDNLAALPARLARLHRVWQARAQLHPLLSAAGSDALQVLGGLGYLRDVGAEKDVRDLNTLRRLGGSPSELTLRCAALDDATEVRR